MSLPRIFAETKTTRSGYGGCAVRFNSHSHSFDKLRMGAFGLRMKSRASPAAFRRRDRQSSGVGERDALLAENALKLFVGVHLADDVAAAEEFAFDIKLRDRRPTGKLLYAQPQLRVLQHVESFELD